MMSFYKQTWLAQLQTDEPQQYRRLMATSAPLGFHHKTHDELRIDDSDRYAGMYVIGVQGVGKSGLLENLIQHDAERGHAVIVIDPHGDLVAHCLAELPPDKVAKTYLLDMEDEGYPFGANVFATGELRTDVQRSQAVDRIMHVFEVLWEDVLSQQHLPRYVRAATITFLANPGATLVDMHAFLLDPDVRHKMLQRVTDPTVKLFWQSQYDNLTPAEQSRRVQPLINRLEALFMGRSLVRNIVGQKRTTINFRRAIEERQLVFIKLPVKTVAQDARLVGTILLAQLYAAVFSFGDVPEQQRPGVSIYVDEFQHFATPDFASLFTEGRKFGVRLTLAHQYRDQLPGFLQQSTMTARTKVVFRTTPSDANEMAREFPAQGGAFEPSIRATRELLGRASDFPPGVREFVETYLRRLPKGNGEIEIVDNGTDLSALWGAERVNIKRPNPLTSLDSLFYEVMKRKDPHLPIPPDAVMGLANGGDGFAGAVRWWNSGHLEHDLQDFPPHLVATGHDGLYWRRRPEGAKEQLLHCLFHLRLTMHYLAASPIGKTSSGSSNVASMLTQLPARATFVKSDKAVGTIFTYDTPVQLSGGALQHRLMTIQAQTRATYCHPRNEIERSIASDPAPDRVPELVDLGRAVEGEIKLRQERGDWPEPRSRWEEVDE